MDKELKDSDRVVRGEWSCYMAVNVKGNLKQES